MSIDIIELTEQSGRNISPIMVTLAVRVDRCSRIIRIEGRDILRLHANFNCWSNVRHRSNKWTPNQSTHMQMHLQKEWLHIQKAAMIAQLSIKLFKSSMWDRHSHYSNPCTYSMYCTACILWMVGLVAAPILLDGKMQRIERYCMYIYQLYSYQHRSSTFCPQSLQAVSLVTASYLR